MELTKFNSGLSPEAFTSQAEQFTQTAPRASGGGVPILKMTKQGDWIYGPDAVEVEEGSTWGIPAESIAQGYIAWHGGKVEGERMSTIGSPAVSPQDLPPVAAKDGWQEQVGFGLVCTTGEDGGVEVVFKSNTRGGIEMFGKLFDAMKARAAQGLSYSPFVKLSSSSYQHSEYGTIYKPELSIEGWAGDDEKPKKRLKPSA